jgi:hypothetical protein
MEELKQGGYVKIIDDMRKLILRKIMAKIKETTTDTFARWQHLSRLSH